MRDVQKFIGEPFNTKSPIPSRRRDGTFLQDVSQVQTIATTQMSIIGELLFVSQSHGLPYEYSEGKHPLPVLKDQE